MMKKELKRLLAVAIACVCFISLFNGTTVYAAMADYAEDYELGEEYSGHVNGTYGENNEIYGSRYFKFEIKEKSHVTLMCKYKDRGYGGSIYNSSGKMVLKGDDISYTENSATGWSTGSQYRVLPVGTYYLEIPDNGRWGILSFDFKFTIQAEKQISLEKGAIASLSSPKKGQLTVKCKTAKNAIGYRITIATNETFTKNKKIVYSPTPSKTITSLKKGTRYYVKVCPYTVYDDGTRVFGQNSLVKTVKIKK